MMSEQEVGHSDKNLAKLEPWLDTLKAWGVPPEAVVDDTHPQHRSPIACEVRAQLVHEAHVSTRWRRAKGKLALRLLRADRRRAPMGIVAWCRMAGDPNGAAPFGDHHRAQLAAELARAGCDPALSVFEPARWVAGEGEWRLQARGWKRAGPAEGAQVPEGNKKLG